MFKNALFLKIILVFTLPAIGMLYFSSKLVYEKIETLSEVDTIQNNIRYIQATQKLIHSVQKERGYSVTVLSAGKYQTQLENQRKQTDKAYTIYLDTILNTNFTDKNMTDDVKKVQASFFALENLRESIHKGTISSLKSIEAYNAINENLLETIFTIAPVRFSAEFSRKFSYLNNLLVAKEKAGIERALTALMVSKKFQSNPVRRMLLQNYAIQNINLKQFLLKAPLDEVNFYNKKIPLPLINKLNAIRVTLVEHKVNEALKVESWWELSTSRIDKLEEIYNYVSGKIFQDAREAENNAYIEQFFSLTFLFVSFVTMISLLFLLRNIIFNEQKSLIKITKQQNVYKLLNSTNKFLIKIDKEKVLFNKICELISENANMSFGFIYKVNKKNTIKLISTQTPLKDIVSQKLQEESEKTNLISEVLKHKRNIIVDSFKTNKSSILSDIAKEYDIHSAAAFPIRKFGKIVAVLVLYSNEHHFFDKEIEILFDNMINDMTHTLERIDYEKTRRKQANELRIASYAFETNEPMIITDENVSIINANQAFCNVMGYAKKDLIGKNPNMFKSKYHDKKFYNALWQEIQTKGSWTGEIYNTKKSKQTLPLRSTITAIKDNKGVISHYLAQYLDISEQKDKQKVLEYQATHDNLTGLPNRLLLLDRIEHAITKVVRHNIVGGLVFIDLDNFKEINDTLGHDIGDKLLIQVAKKLKTTIRDEDTVSRIGGDEFIVLADCIGNKEEAKENMMHLAEKIKLSLNSIIEIDGHKNISTPSIGITLFSDASISVKDIIKQADTAMYQAKKQGKNTIEFFN